MGVYIPGMEMPKEEPIIVKICPDGDVCGVRGGIIAKAIPVPPHGRLGDLDKLKSALWKERLPVDVDGMLEEETTWRQGKNAGLLTAQCCINNADTIIPAEEART